MLNFIKLINKVRRAQCQVREGIRQERRATCPQLARATGLSLVTVHREIREMEKRGEVREIGREVRGGRPSPIYEFVRDYAVRAYVQMWREQGLIRVTMERLDLSGAVQARSIGNFAAVEKESLDGRLDDLLRGKRVLGIGIYSAPIERQEALRSHLSARYSCAVGHMNAAEALAQRMEGGVTLYWVRGGVPQGCIWRGGEFHDLGRLDMLSLPVPWESMDYTDHTLVEEMVARLLQILVCVLAPTSINLYADFWSPKLVGRIRFNTQSKLRGIAPPLRFGSCTDQMLRAELHRLACFVGEVPD